MWMPGLMNGIGSIFGGIQMMNNNPATQAMGYSEQLPGVVKPYYEPYIETGLAAQEELWDEYMKLISNPQVVYDMLAGGFEQSPGYEWQYDQAMNAANNAAAAGGMSGTPAHMTNASTIAQNTAAQDYYNYLDRMFGLYGMGMGGMSDFNKMGYQASDALAGLLAQNLMNQAGLAALEAQNQNSAMGSIVGGATSAVGSIF
jgi:hypothetical protein